MERKLTLDLESITVTTFETNAEPKEIGAMVSGIPNCSNCNTRLTCSSALC